MFMKASAQKKQRRLAREACESECLDTIPWEQVSITAVFFHKQNRTRDPDNAIASLKSAFDGLVDAGLVSNDDWTRMIREPPEFKIDKMFPRVELHIVRLK